MTYKELMYTRLLNIVDNYCGQYYSGLILLQEFLNEANSHHFHP